MSAFIFFWKSFSPLFRSFLVKATLLGLFTVTLILPSVSASPKRPSIAKNRIDEINQEEGAQRLEGLRKYRLAGDFIFKFELVHYPYREDEITLTGTLFGSANINGPILRIHLKEPDNEVQKLLLQNGVSPIYWHTNKTDEVKPLKGTELFEPVSDKLVYSPFDFQMPFIHWSNFLYHGSKRVKGRPTHLFHMFPPSEVKDAQPNLKLIEMALDASYNALVRVNMLNQDDKTFKQIEMLSIKKTQGQYIPKVIDLIDKTNRSKTRFRVTAAALNLELPTSLFKPSNLNQTLPFIDKAPFDHF